MKNHNSSKWTFVITKIILSVFLAFISFTVEAQETATSSQRIIGTDTLVFYKNVPDVLPSKFYKIEVRSAATNNQWHNIYANITSSLWSDIKIDGTGNKEHYYSYVKDWSHTYANIEMGKGTKVEVKISAINGFTIRPTVYPNGFFKANLHPEGKARDMIVDADGNVTFTIYEPGQFTVDINGQMDEVNTGNGYSGPPIHAISIFANPYMKKPIIDETVQLVEPGVKPSPLLGNKKTLYFKPGRHDIGRDFRIYANKNYYIPGDAIVYGTLSNESINGDNPDSPGDNIKIYGYGTLSGDLIKHSLYDPGYTDTKSDYFQNDKSWKLIWAVNCTNFVVEGLSLMNTPKHTAVFVPRRDSTKKETFGSWLKTITWRGNGDGLGPDQLTDSFFRCQDDCTYIVGDRSRCVFWTDVNGTALMMAQMPPSTKRSVIVDDCDVIYARHSNSKWAGGRVFSKRADQAPKGIGTEEVDVTFSNIRITDPFQTMETFSILSISGTETSKGYKGITFKNITSVKEPLATHNRIVGHENGAFENITFDNVVLGGKKILSKADFAAMAPFVNNVKFISGVPVTGVSVSGCPTSAMNVNATKQLAATVAPTNASNKFVRWSSSNTAVALVSSDGLVTAKAAGSATITVTTVDGNKTAMCNVTVATSAPAQTPYGGVNRKIPGLIEAEHYDEGVEGSAFHDNTTKQGVLLYRADDMVDVVNKTAASNGKAVGYTLDGEWLEYKVDVTAGTYDIKLSYFCTISTAGDLKVFLGDTLLTTFTNIAAQTSSTVLAHTTIPKISIEGGTNQTLRLEVLGAKFDIDAINFSRSATTTKISSGKTTESESVDNGFRIYPNPVSDILNLEFTDATSSKQIKVFNAIGQLVYSAKTTKGSTTIDVKTLNLKGVVMVQVVTGSSVYNNKVIIK